MAELDFTKAQSLAVSLTTIGHPYAQAAVDATAWDLVDCCKGVFIDGRAFTPEQQAQTLVTEARRHWDEWPEQGGTKQLLALFHRMFTPQKDEQAEKRLQWEREYGPRDKNWPRNFLDKAVNLSNSPGKLSKAEFERQKREMLLQGIKDAIYYTEGEGRFDFEEERGDHEERRRQKRHSETFWHDAMRHYNEKHPETLTEVRRGTV